MSAFERWFPVALQWAGLACYVGVMLMIWRLVGRLERCLRERRRGEDRDDADWWKD